MSKSVKEAAGKVSMRKPKVTAVEPEAAMPQRSRTLLEQVKSNIDRVKEAFQADPLFLENPENVETGTAVAAWSMLDALLDVITERKEQYRQELLKRAERDGVPTDKGGQRLWVDDSEIVREKRQEKLPEETNFRLLLATKGIPFTEVFDEVKTLKMNPSKIDYLVQTGRVTKAEVEELCKKSFAMKVNKSELLEKVLDDCTNVILGQPIGTKRLKAK